MDNLLIKKSLINVAGWSRLRTLHVDDHIIRLEITLEHCSNCDRCNERYAKIKSILEDRKEEHGFCLHGYLFLARRDFPLKDPLIDIRDRLGLTITLCNPSCETC